MDSSVSYASLGGVWYTSKNRCIGTQGDVFECVIVYSQLAVRNAVVGLTLHLPRERVKIVELASSDSSDSIEDDLVRQPPILKKFNQRRNST